MYYLSSTNPFQNGRTFESLADAKRTADNLAASEPNSPFDVLAFVDRDSYRVVYSPPISQTSPANLGTYCKFVPRSTTTNTENTTMHDTTTTNTENTTMHDPTTNNNSHKTAIARRKPSAPAKWICGEGLWFHSSLLDFGCGRSVDAAYYASQGFAARKVDPYWTSGETCYPDGNAIDDGAVEHRANYDVITCTYVLNVIECWVDRDAVLHRIHDLLADHGTAYIAVRADVKEAHTTKTGTWQAPIRIGNTNPGKGDFMPVHETPGFHMYELTRDDLANAYAYVAE